MKSRRGSLPQRVPIYVGCEGESEQGYAGLLQDLAKDDGRHVHIKAEVLHGGDPLARVEIAIDRLQRGRKRGDDFLHRFLLLDTDQLEADKARARRARELAEQNQITVIWQEPCFEAFLLRHLPDRTSHKPPTSADANNRLRREWPEYQKPMTRAELARRIDLEAVARAAEVEEKLRDLLRCLGLLR